MKKSFILIAAVAMMASCSDNAVKDVADEQKAEQALSFSAYADKVTRGTNSTALNDFYTVFGVYGWKTVAKTEGTGTEEKPVFENTPNEYFTAKASGEVVYDADGEDPEMEWSLANMYPAWYYESIRYWDKMATSYQFFAIAPYEANPTYAVEANANNITIATADSKYDISKEYNLARTDLTANPISETEAPKGELTYSPTRRF